MAMDGRVGAANRETCDMTQIATVSMKQFRENIGDDEHMLKFAADNLDAPDDCKVQIRVNGQFVTFELIPAVHEVDVRKDNKRASCSCGWAAARNEPFDDLELHTLIEAHLK